MFFCNNFRWLLQSVLQIGCASEITVTGDMFQKRSGTRLILNFRETENVCTICIAAFIKVFPVILLVRLQGKSFSFWCFLLCMPQVRGRMASAFCCILTLKLENSLCGISPVRKWFFSWTYAADLFQTVFHLQMRRHQTIVAKAARAPLKLPGDVSGQGAKRRRKSFSQRSGEKWLAAKRRDSTVGYADRTKCVSASYALYDFWPLLERKRRKGQYLHNLCGLPDYNFVSFLGGFRL